MRRLFGAFWHLACLATAFSAAILSSRPALAEGETCAPPSMVELPSEASFAVGRKDYELNERVKINRDTVRIAATVRYPMAADGSVLGKSKLPLVVFLHGNHGIVRYDDGTDVCSFQDHLLETPNHAGYDFALESLARRGYVAISINGNDLNCLNDRIAERGQLILEHLALWKKLASPQDPLWNKLFQNRIDFTRVGLVGHSRGGEAIVDAAMKNRDPEIRIGGLFSIAPVDIHSYTWSGRTPLFMLLPAGDGDVTDNAGARIYDRMRLTQPESFKVQQYLYGANHNWFNTEWRDDDAVDTDETIGMRLTPEEQRQFMLEFLVVFFGYTLKDQTAYGPVLEGDVKLASLANFASYPSFESGAALTIDDFERRPDQIMINSLNGEIKHDGFTSFFRRWIGGSSSGALFVNQTRALLATWLGRNVSFSTSIPREHQRYAAGQRILSFRTALVQPMLSKADANTEPLNMAVSVVDSAGREATVDLASLGALLPRPYGSYNSMHTVRIPLACFQLGEDGPDLGKIEHLRFTVPGGPDKESIAMDQIQVSP